MKKMTQNRMVKPEDMKLTLRGDISRIRQFIAKNIAKQVVQKIKDEDAPNVGPESSKEK